jgi:hypothetical protein
VRLELGEGFADHDLLRRTLLQQPPAMRQSKRICGTPRKNCGRGSRLGHSSHLATDQPIANMPPTG